MKYQSSSTRCSKEINTVKVFKKWIKLQGQGHMVKIVGTHIKILSQEMTMYNMEAFSVLSLRSYDQCQFFLIIQMSRSKD